MAYRFEIEGSALKITDTISGEFSLLPAKATWYNNAKLEENLVVLAGLDYAIDNAYKHSEFFGNGQLLSDCLDGANSDTPFTESTFKTFVSSYLGKSSGSAGGGSVDSVFGRDGEVTAQAGDYSAFYEGVLGNPSENGYVLASNTDGTRTWVAQAGGGVADVIPALTIVDPTPVDEGVIWIGSAVPDKTYPYIAYRMFDYTGTPSTFNEFSETGNFGGQENTPGTYSAKIKAYTAMGVSAEYTMDIQVNSFTLTRDNMFGTLDNLLAFYSLMGDPRTDYTAFIGCAVQQGGSFYIDRDGSLDAQATDYVMFWSYSAQRLVAFRINGLSQVDYIIYWDSVSNIAQGTLLNGTGFTYLSSGSQLNSALNSNVRGKHVPIGGYYNGGLSGEYFLSLVASGTEFNNFGARNSDWSYSFLLTDDWIGGALGNQMLSPIGTDFIVNTIAGFGIGTSPYEYVYYGDHDSGPYSSSTSDFNISSRNWVIASAGQLVTVAYNSSTQLWYLYVDNDVLIDGNGSLDTYFPATNSATELRFGDIAGSNLSAQPTSYDEPAGWSFRFDSLAIANGTYWDATAVANLVTNKLDLSLSSQYANMTTLAEFDGSGVNNIKGTPTITRGAVTF